MPSTTQSDSQLVELRRRQIPPGSRQQVDERFDAGPEAGLVYGHFFERERGDCFTWLRGFPSAVNHALYAGPDDDVLLLRPLYRDSALPRLRAVDPVAEPGGAQGIAVVHIFRVAPGMLEACASAADACFLGYTGHGVTEAAILATPLQDGAPISLVWIGMLRDEATLAALRPRFDAAAARLAEAGLLDGAAELLVMDPGKRSRLRWLLAQAA
jgi:DNA-directed RNA polymerase subunit H (RpoH/RPB5)